ncbi:methylcobalamin:coenzyme M methyltransferase [Limihaloglobus sulfuriphilus]|uniref:Methylcobalamin:coenzyme M methyltransferase n=1 Tax=Limihaloglobus sulfuriphilus TaxID=1851148 RepID=A0A1Q2MFV9_9BACT|nr:uroporphyrinogen decarboxylase family protein [Limihaloglobus sulfuriphilus]AQQ71573.1 methylcobalamin:coenzyme M methyltransferase [Limihaloglobus sulfuriphilus]
MTGKERLLTAIKGGIPDHVPAAPDLYEMIPIRVSGKKPWDIIAYNDPPVWKARIDACRKFGVDAYIPLWIPAADEPVSAVVKRTDEQIIVRRFTELEGKRRWERDVMVLTDGHASSIVRASQMGISDELEDFEIIRPDYQAADRRYFEDARGYLGDDGVIAPMVSLPVLSHSEEEMLAYFDDSQKIKQEKHEIGTAVLERVKEILSWKPDTLLIGNSGMMLFNPPPIFRELGLYLLQEITRLCKQAGVATNLHCCGTERELVKIAAEESELNCIEPLEPPPMGDCDLAQIKQTFGSRIALKGNLHTTEIMLMGSVEQVADACKKAIDAAVAGGGFILSTGDQVPMGTPFENIEIMMKVAQTYGRY